MQRVSYLFIMAYNDKTKIWIAIKDHLRELEFAKVNPIEFLIWTQVMIMIEIKFDNYF